MKQSPRISKHIQTYLIGSFSFQYFTEQKNVDIPLIPGRWPCRTSPSTTLRVVFAVMDARLQWTQVPPCLQDLRPWSAVCRPEIFAETMETQCESGNTKLLQGESGARGNLGTFCMVSLMIAVCFLHRPGQADCSNYDSLPNIGFKIGNKAEDFCPRCSILIYFAFSRS